MAAATLKTNPGLPRMLFRKACATGMAVAPRGTPRGQHFRHPRTQPHRPAQYAYGSPTLRCLPCASRVSEKTFFCPPYGGHGDEKTFCCSPYGGRWMKKRFVSNPAATGSIKNHFFAHPVYRQHMKKRSVGCHVTAWLMKKRISIPLKTARPMATGVWAHRLAAECAKMTHSGSHY